MLISFSRSIHLSAAPTVSMTNKKKVPKQKVEKKEPVEEDLKTNTAVDDEEVNSGFGSYLRSATGKDLSITAVLKAFQVFSSFRPRDVETVCRCELACNVPDCCLAANSNCLRSYCGIISRKIRFH